MIIKKHNSLFLFAMACLLCLVACENSREEINAWNDTKEPPEEAYNIQSYLSQQGIMKAKLSAPLMLRFKDTVEFPKKLHVDFYNDSIKVETKLDSRYGIYYQNQSKIYLRDSVLIVTVKGDSLWCHDLWWDQNRQLFYTDTIARFRAPGKKITGGKGMEASQDLSTVTFKYPIGVIQTGDDGLLSPSK